jgi:hypothetical protein
VNGVFVGWVLSLKSGLRMLCSGWLDGRTGSGCLGVTDQKRVQIWRFLLPQKISGRKGLPSCGLPDDYAVQIS